MPSSEDGVPSTLCTQLLDGGEGEARAAAAGALRAGAFVVVACRAAEGTTDERGGTIHDRACGVSE